MDKKTLRTDEEIENLMAVHCPWYGKPKNKWTADERNKADVLRRMFSDRSTTIDGQQIGVEAVLLTEPETEGLTSRANPSEITVNTDVVGFLPIPEIQKPNLIGNLEESIAAGESPLVYVWQGKIIAGELGYEIAERMKAKSNHIVLELDCVEAAKAFRLEKMISSQIQLSSFSRIEAVLPLKDYFKRIGKQRMSEGGRLKETSNQKHDTNAILAQKAQVSRTDVGRATRVIKAFKNDPEMGELMFTALRNDEKTLSAVDNDIKGKAYRGKAEKRSGAKKTDPTIAPGVRKEIDLDCYEPQVVCGNSLEILSKIPEHVFSGMVFGSPPYYGVKYDYGHNFKLFKSLEDWAQCMAEYNKQFARILKHDGSRVVW